MKTEVGSYEAKSTLPKLLRQVRQGRSFTITNRGEAVADLVPSASARPRDPAGTAQRLKAFMHSASGSRVDIKALIEEGRS
jgi:prevent-host-death family protein